MSAWEAIPIWETGRFVLYLGDSRIIWESWHVCRSNVNVGYCYLKITHLSALSFTKSQLAAAAAAATAVTPSSMEHNVSPMQQSSVQHLTNQMNQLQMSGSQYITSPVHSTFSQASWQMMHQHGQPQHAHPHYMSLEVRANGLMHYKKDHGIYIFYP